jgi:hypothetical protein
MGREGGNSAALAEKLVYPVYLGGAPRVKGFRGQDFGGNEEQGELNRRPRRTLRKKREETGEEKSGIGPCEIGYGAGISSQLSIIVAEGASTSSAEVR